MRKPTYIYYIYYNYVYLTPLFDTKITFKSSMSGSLCLSYLNSILQLTWLVVEFCELQRVSFQVLNWRVDTIFFKIYSLRFMKS